MTKENASASTNDLPAVPYLFVVGCPRSGTTLLQGMLDAHRQLIVAYDTLFIPKAVPRLKPGKNPKLTPEIVEKLRTVGYTTATRDRLPAVKAGPIVC